jgi:hypothetical protein
MTDGARQAGRQAVSRFSGVFRVVWVCGMSTLALFFFRKISKLDLI